MISIVIPFYNEEAVLFRNLTIFKNLSKKSELIFVDGGSSDRSAQIVRGCGMLLGCEKGRAVQMNKGAKSASADILLFLHADSFIQEEALASIEDSVKNRNFIAGCLAQRIDAPGFIYRFIESFGNIRAKATKVFYGDQGIFVRKGAFLKMGGFPDVPVMEDVLFTKRLRKLGKTAVLPDKIFVSARRWKKKGIISTIFLYSFISALFYLGAPLARIKLAYDDLR